tara:strand:+ start:1641 stop:2798 length:1158 start_codon:yes stop_codon:yes gene_type:complete
MRKIILLTLIGVIFSMNRDLIYYAYPDMNDAYLITQHKPLIVEFKYSPSYNLILKQPCFYSNIQNYLEDNGRFTPVTQGPYLLPYLKKIDSHTYMFNSHYAGQDWKFRANDKYYRFYNGDYLFGFKPIKDIPKFPSDNHIENIKIESKYSIDTKETFLYANNKVNVTFDIRNHGRGAAHGILIQLYTKDLNGEINFAPYYIIQDPIKPGESYKVTIPVSSTMAAKDRDYTFVIAAKEFFGFNPSNKTFNLKVREVPTPDFSLEGFRVDDDRNGESYGNGDGLIQRGESIELYIRIKNTGEYLAKNLNVDFSFVNKSEGLYIPKDQNLSYEIKELEANDERELKIYFYTSKSNFISAIPIQVEIKESTGEFGRTFDLNLPVYKANP